MKYYKFIPLIILIYGCAGTRVPLSAEFKGVGQVYWESVGFQKYNGNISTVRFFDSDSFLIREDTYDARDRSNNHRETSLFYLDSSGSLVKKEILFLKNPSNKLTYHFDAVGQEIIVIDFKDSRGGRLTTLKTYSEPDSLGLVSVLETKLYHIGVSLINETTETKELSNDVLNYLVQRNHGKFWNSRGREHKNRVYVFEEDMLIETQHYSTDGDLMYVEKWTYEELD